MKRVVASVVVGAVVITGCAVGPNYQAPRTQTPMRWVEVPESQPAGEAERASATSRPAVELSAWWESFGDPQLTALVHRAARANPDVQVAAARVREARSQRDIARSEFWPQIGLGGSYNYRGASQNATPRSSTKTGIPRTILNQVLQGIRISPGGVNTVTNSLIAPSLNVAGGGTDANGNPIGGSSFSVGSLLNSGSTSTRTRRDQNLYQLGFDASWELDLFGRIRRSVEAADADMQALVESQRDVTVTLLSEVARNYIELRGAQRRLAIARENIITQQDSLAVSEDRFRAGFTNELDVAQARAQLETTRSQIPLLETAIRQTIYQISVLCGELPGTLLEELSAQQPLPQVIPFVPTGLPSDLLRRRPDIRQAERELAAATARIGVATAELFPQVSLTGSFGTQSADMKHFLDHMSLFWGVGPSVQWPIFQGGRIRANIRAEEAREAQSLATYAGRVLVAFQEVENSRVAYNQERVRRETLNEAVRASQRATELSNDLYTRGLGPFLNVLEAQRSLYATQDELVLSETAVMTNLVALYKAMGGGWETVGPPATQPVIAAEMSVQPRKHELPFP